MNSMANHGYLPRDGKCINANVIIDALIACFNLSKPLAWFLTHGALLLLHQGAGDFQLADLARHNRVEHNGSLYHPDAGPRDEYAPLAGDPALLAAVFADSASGVAMTPEDIARVRVRREATSHPPLDLIHAELARGEVAIVLNMMNNPDSDIHAKGIALQPRSSVSRFIRSVLRIRDDPKKRQLDGVPNERLRYWFEHERLPPDWEPYHKTTLRETISTINRLRSAMKKQAKEQAKQVVQEAPAVVVTEPVKVEVQKAEPEGEAERTSTAMKTEEASDGEDASDASVPAVPPLLHSRFASSATSSTFTDVLHTPEAPEFTVPPFVVDPKTIAPPHDSVAPAKQQVLDAVELPTVTVSSA